MIGIDQLTNRKLNFIEEYPFVLQRRKNDCGIACIEMVCLYYSVKNYKNIIGEISLNEKGLSIEKMVIFSEKYGQGYERSERTLKRIQSSALKKMVDFINQSSLKEYFHE